nr:PREDICTED: uncharacterized protein LOC103314780 [Tribolium castaneum]|eukprot:XP_015839547.1 PREDICTED: uncharacterized protein LOC103314780 [Tribolium castaneum]
MAKKRNRAISLSLDWDNMVKEGESEKGAMAHLAGNIAYDKDTVEFCTGSSYTGKWNALGMAVYGTYLYPHGERGSLHARSIVTAHKNPFMKILPTAPISQFFPLKTPFQGCEYEGGFEDGMFHGEGVLVYPMGQKLEGYWEKGKMMDYKFTNVDGLDYTEPWLYCTMPDRRYNVTIREGLQPAGREFLTNQQPDRPIEQDCYDTGDGFYNPITRSIIMARDPEEYEYKMLYINTQAIKVDAAYIGGLLKLKFSCALNVSQFARFLKNLLKNTRVPQNDDKLIV